MISSLISKPRAFVNRGVPSIVEVVRDFLLLVFWDQFLLLWFHYVFVLIVFLVFLFLCLFIFLKDWAHLYFIFPFIFRRHDMYHMWWGKCLMMSVKSYGKVWKGITSQRWTIRREKNEILFDFGTVWILFYFIFTKHSHLHGNMGEGRNFTLCKLSDWCQSGEPKVWLNYECRWVEQFFEKN